MKLTDNANFAMQMLFDEQGRLDEAFILRAWPYSSMAQEELDRLKSGLIELEAFGLVETRNSVVHGRKVVEKVLKRQQDCEPLWTRNIDSSIPVQ